MALTDPAKEIKWIRDELHYGITPRPSTILKMDNQGALALAKNPVHPTRSKHIDIKHHYIRETIAQGIVWLDSGFSHQAFGARWPPEVPLSHWYEVEGA